MEENLVRFFEEYSNYALLISILANIIVAVFGVIPSFFVTGANILFFGFWLGTLISFLGEAVGAIVAFVLYRKGFRKLSTLTVEKYPKAKMLLWKQGREAFYLILSLRLLPFVPSGLVTFISSIGKVSFIIFAIASTLGKVPALLIEAYSVYQVTQWTWQGKVILVVIGLYIVLLAFKNKKTRV
ncbi:TVP38/TMEM64 family protein [Anaerobacillus sp. CMMVII]|uniref:TVP38/TMEM64 family protein n=1 Tax=Anaerobacillus sp. CMMVII TaxID=2755588 RepID=UPI0021B825AA|nr:VTT domain-containing protein [Anaerobacillus sp. CMMVII]MCT8139313.1 TVP38/TMEM64 family protein [Anaerobacillus sp. CMMVII]